MSRKVSVMTEPPSAAVAVLMDELSRMSPEQQAELLEGLLDERDQRDDDEG
jgi:hypothetical protein